MYFRKNKEKMLQEETKAGIILRCIITFYIYLVRYYLGDKEEMSKRRFGFLGLYFLLTVYFTSNGITQEAQQIDPEMMKAYIKMMAVNENLVDKEAVDLELTNILIIPQQNNSGSGNIE
jgi:hypothetical protein